MQQIFVVIQLRMFLVVRPTLMKEDSRLDRG
jgi:hypothetical protein